MKTWKQRYREDLVQIKNKVLALRSEADKLDVKLEELEHFYCLKNEFKPASIPLDSVEDARALHEIASMYVLHPPINAPYVKFAEELAVYLADKL